MEHWKLDEHDAAFEDDRQERDKQRRVEAARVHEESSQFYQLARAVQERTIPQQQPSSSAGSSQQLHATLSDKKRKAQVVQRLSCVKVTKVAVREPDVRAAAPASALAAPAEQCGGNVSLPGMSAYDDDSSSDEPT